MRRLFVCAFMIMSLATVARAGTITWGYGGSLGASYNNYFVQLYEDEGKDGWGPGYTIDTLNDKLVTGVNATVLNDSGDYYWGSGFSSPSGVLAVGDHVYTVIYDGPSVIGSTHYQIVDADPFLLPDPEKDAPYVLGSVSGGWIEIAAVPEPTTLALLALGAVTVFARRRHIAKQRVA